MELMTMAEIAKQSGLPESTVRYYRERFAPYVPAVGEGRGRSEADMCWLSLL